MTAHHSEIAPAGIAGDDDWKILLRAFNPDGNNRGGCAMGMATSAGCGALTIVFFFKNADLNV